MIDSWTVVNGRSVVSRSKGHVLLFALVTQSPSGRKGVSEDPSAPGCSVSSKHSLLFQPFDFWPDVRSNRHLWKLTSEIDCYLRRPVYLREHVQSTHRWRVLWRFTIATNICIYNHLHVRTSLIKQHILAESNHKMF